MVRIYQQSQMDPRQEWLQALGILHSLFSIQHILIRTVKPLEQQAREKREQKEREKQERLGESASYFGSDASPHGNHQTSSTSFNNTASGNNARSEFGGRRRPYQDIVKFEKDFVGALPVVAPKGLSKTEEYFQKRMLAERQALEEESVVRQCT
jgi:hypothetical protein